MTALLLPQITSNSISSRSIPERDNTLKAIKKSDKMLENETKLSHQEARMKLAHITYADTGGASASAYRLHRSLLDAGIDSSFFVVKHVGAWDGCRTLPQSAKNVGIIRKKGEKLLNKMFLRTGKTACNVHLQWTDRGHLPELDRQYDIIHLHWADGEVASIFEIAALTTPVVWTLHDMRAFNGGHYYDGFGVIAGEEVLYDITSLKKNPVVRFNQLVKRIVMRPKNINAIAPSRWIFDEAERSAVFCKSNLHHVPYGIAPADDVIGLRERERARLGLKSNDKVLLYGAYAVGYARKGHDLLMKALEWAESTGSETGETHFFTFGQGEFTAPGIYKKKHRHFGYIGSEDEMNGLYAVADAFVAPSREDNLPNVVLESLRCGTPTIAFRIGGLPDMIEDGRNGRLIEPFDTSALGEAIVDLLHGYGGKDLLDRSEIIQRVLDQFSLERQLESTIQVYSACLA